MNLFQLREKLKLVRERFGRALTEGRVEVASELTREMGAINQEIELREHVPFERKGHEDRTTEV